MIAIHLHHVAGNRVWIAYVEDARAQILTGRVGEAADEQILTFDDPASAEARVRQLADEQITSHGFIERPDQIIDDRVSKFPGLADRLDVEIIDLSWTRGLVTAATLLREPLLKTSLAKLTARFLQLPVTRRLRALRFGFAEFDRHGTLRDWKETFKAVAASQQARHLKVLRFDYVTDDSVPLDSTIIGNLSGHWDAFPALETLSLRGIAAELGDMRLPSLRTFQWTTTEIHDDEIDVLERAYLPKLTRLELDGAPEAVRDRLAKRLVTARPTPARRTKPRR